MERRSLLGESNPDCFRTGEACLPLPLSRRESCCGFLVCSAGVEPATDGSSSRPLYLSWSTSTWSRHPVPTRAIRCTKAEPQPCAAASLPTVDSNHDQHNQTVPSCRLDEWALSALSAVKCGRRDSNAQTARFELARSPNCRHFRVRRRG